MPNLRLLWVVLKRSGASRVLLGFLAVYLLCAAVVFIVEPDVTNFVDALWFLWAVSTTVGLGDVTAHTIIGRLAAVICSLYAICTTAVITAVVVDYFNEMRQQQYGESLAMFLDKLERLPELDHDELVEISERVKANRK